MKKATDASQVRGFFGESSVWPTNEIFEEGSQAAAPAVITRMPIGILVFAGP